VTTPDAAPPVYVGTAGWSLPRAEQHRFPEEGTHLVRYAGVLGAVEINSSFYRPHRPSTYEKWAASTPASFRFSVKIPRAITHDRRLVDVDAPLDAFLAEAGALGERLGCLLVQLPPSLELRPREAEAFLAALRERHDGDVAVEPRHVTWFTPEGDALLRRMRVARVAADPPRAPGGDEPGGWPGVTYHRLHGSPRVYYSDYDAAYLERLAAVLHGLARGGTTAWCIFDNTALGAATANALDVRRMLGKPDA
jgi:uncharacterized protein YecE (DUF72 family)